MADITNLSNFLTDIADAIRTKKETNDAILAQDFDTEILNIETEVEATVEFDGLTADIEGEVLVLEDGQPQTSDINMAVAYSRDQTTTGITWGLPSVKFSSSYVVGDTFEVGEDRITLLKDVSKLFISADLVLKKDSFNWTGADAAIAIIWTLMQEDGTLVDGTKREAYDSDNPMAYHLEYTITNVKAGSYFGIGHYTNTTSDSYTTWAGTNLMLIEVEE